MRIGFETHGCRSNWADTVELQAACAELGGTPCEFGGEADIYVLNTCAVTDQAEKEALRTIRRLKARVPKAEVVVTGCLAELKSEMLREIDGVRAVFGPAEKRAVLSAIFGRASHDLDGHVSATIPGPGGFLGEVATRHRFHLRIQEGCENHCTFCIIPTTRGQLRSRAVSAILADIKTLQERGFEEIVLTGTHIGGYGEDCQSSLVQLLRSIESSQPSARIRLSSIDPNDLNEDIIALLAQSNVFCQHLHICVQAFSDRILKRMNRRYRMKEVRRLIRSIEREFTSIGVGSDLITGFPGETRDEVEEQLAIFSEMPFSYLHVFPFSEREETPATKLKDSVPVAERRRRAVRWRAVADARRSELLRRADRRGAKLEVLIEGADGFYSYGTTREFLRARVPSAPQGKSSLVPGKRYSCVWDRFDPIDGAVVCEL